MTIEWRPIPRLAGKYEAGSNGRLRNAQSLRVLSDRARSEGGYVVNRPCFGNLRTYLSHTLVAEAFIGPKPAGLDVNHKNGIKTDNRPENLEYVTRAENMAHAERLGLIDRDRQRTGAALSRSPFSLDDVRDIRAFLRDGANQRDLARGYGVDPQRISRIKRGAWSWVA